MLVPRLHSVDSIRLAFTLGVNLDALRDANSLWRLQTLPAGQILRIPLARTEKYNEHQVERGETLKTIADALNSQPWQIIRNNVLFWNESINPGMVVKVRPEEPKPIHLTHHVASGDTLGAFVGQSLRHQHRGHPVCQHPRTKHHD